MARNFCSLFLAGLLLSLGASSHLFGRQESMIAMLKPGLDEITEGRVTATISFLASDELAGRATGSTEFNIAAGYVASRFRGAGLDGKLGDVNFYHVTMKQLVRTPAGPLKLVSADGQPISHFGLLAAGPEPMSYTL